MSDGGTGGQRGRGRGGHRSAAEALADRLAAALVRHQPGWRLPRHTVLARRYQVSTAEIEVALGELTARQLIRRQPDGQLYRVSPVKHRVPIEGVPGLGTLADPMGGQLVCASREASLSEVPGDIGRALGVSPGGQVGVIRTEWATAHGEPAAFCTTYLLRDIAAPFLDGDDGSDVTAIGTPAAVYLDLRPPSAALASRLQLPAGESAVLVTTRFDDPEKQQPVALTTAVFRPDLFRVVVQAAGQSLAGNDAGALARMTGDHET